MPIIIDLAKNSNGIQIYSGEIQDIKKIYGLLSDTYNYNFISKEHPAFDYYPGIKEERDWMFPNIVGYFPSFFSYWKKCYNKLK